MPGHDTYIGAGNEARMARGSSVEKKDDVRVDLFGGVRIMGDPQVTMGFNAKSWLVWGVPLFLSNPNMINMVVMWLGAGW